MVRSTIILSAIIACIGSISAIPTPDGSLLNIASEKHIGTGEIIFNNLLNDAGSVDDAEIEGKNYNYHYFFYNTNSMP